MVSGNGKEIIPPEDMIDHNDANFSQIEKIMTIFVAYNQANIQQGTPWDNWPDWELCLTAMNPDVHFEDEGESVGIRAVREHWLAVMQFIHDSEHIELDDYLITVNGVHGNTFNFAICFQTEMWGTPIMTKDGLQECFKDIGLDPIPFPHITPSEIGHSLGPLWVCPEHVPEYGGEQFYCSEDSICISKGRDDTFPSALYSLLNLCIDDTKIWANACASDLEMHNNMHRMNENWPGGIPEDWEYQ
jgi:hypothetical protein